MLCNTINHSITISKFKGRAFTSFFLMWVTLDLATLNFNFHLEQQLRIWSDIFCRLHSQSQLELRTMSSAYNKNETLSCPLFILQPHQLISINHLQIIRIRWTINNRLSYAHFNIEPIRIRPHTCVGIPVDRLEASINFTINIIIQQLQQ